MKNTEKHVNHNMKWDGPLQDALVSLKSLDIPHLMWISGIL